MVVLVNTSAVVGTYLVNTSWDDMVPVVVNKVNSDLVGVDCGVCLRVEVATVAAKAASEALELLVDRFRLLSEWLISVVAAAVKLFAMLVHK